MPLLLIDDPTAPWYWPPLPAGRRRRREEHARRARAVFLARNLLVCTLVQRIHQLAGFEPHAMVLGAIQHPRLCTPNCEWCAAIERARRAVEFLMGLDPRIPRRFFWPGAAP